MRPTRRKITWVAVADGAKALILVNDGTDRAPTSRAGGPVSGRASFRQWRPTDWHEFGEGRFVAEFAARLNRAAQRGLFERLILVAPPRVLGRLRPALSAPAAACVVAEIGSDLTGHPVDEIEKNIAKALAG